MTENEFSVIIAKISRFYPRFYEGQDAKKVFSDWFENFKDNSFDVVHRAVVAHINTSKFAPTVSDIKSLIVESYLQDKPTAMQAFQRISRAVRKSYNREDAIKQYNELPPILQKLVSEPSQLLDWNKVSTESFQTVIMSAIRESYKELTAREAKYYAFPENLQRAEQWRISEPETVALPEPVKEKTVTEMLDEMDRNAAEFRRQHGMTANPKYNDKVDAFKSPVTKEDLKRMEYVERKMDALLKKWS